MRSPTSCARTAPAPCPMRRPSECWPGCAAAGARRAARGAHALRSARRRPGVPSLRAEPVVGRRRAYLRPGLLPGLVRRVEHNWAVRERDVRLFEVGTVFRARPGAAPEERLALAAVLTGARRPPHWSEGAKVPDMDIWDLKHHFELAVSAAAPGARVIPADGDGSVAGGVGRRAAGRSAGRRGCRRMRPKWAAPVLGLRGRDRRGCRSSSLLRAAARPAADAAGSVAGAAGRRHGGAGRRMRCGARGARCSSGSIVLDEYRGPAIPAGTRGVTWRCVFRDPTRTLRDSEVDEVIRAGAGPLGGRTGCTTQSELTSWRWSSSRRCCARSPRSWRRGARAR